MIFPWMAMNKVAEFEQDKVSDKGISTFIKEVQIEDLLGRDPIVLNNPLPSGSTSTALRVDHLSLWLYR